MARITVEDCIDKFSSRFELVLVASNRARRLHSGETPTVDKDNDKNTVIALREIADETLSKDKLRSDLIEEYQSTSFIDEEEEFTENNDEDSTEIKENNENSIQNENEQNDSTNVLESANDVFVDNVEKEVKIEDSNAETSEINDDVKQEDSNNQIPSNSEENI